MREDNSSTSGGKFFIILGIGRVGVSVSHYLLSLGSTLIFGYDDNPLVFEKEPVKSLMKNKRFIPIKNLNEMDARLEDLRIGRARESGIGNWESVRTIASPGISQNSPIIRFLQAKGVEIIDEIEFTYRRLNDLNFLNGLNGSNRSKGRIVAITGTNGKSTTSALIAELLKAQGKQVFLGGNIAPGEPFSQALFETQRDYYVLEVSSFQLERINTFRPSVAILLNIREDHLNRYRTIKEYANIKFRIFQNQTKKDCAIINGADPLIKKNLNLIPSKIFYFLKKGNREEVGRILSPCSGFRVPSSILRASLPKEDEFSLIGEHNRENLLASILAVKLLVPKISARTIKTVCQNFKGLPHRLEFVAVKDGRTFINNSMCTNPSAAVASLLAVSRKLRPNSPKRKIVLIAGGKDKNLSIKSLVKAIKTMTKWTILVGQNRNEIKSQLRKVGYENFDLSSSLKDSVIRAMKRTNPGDTVLFSPGFASFGDFSNFIERGEAFKDAVSQL